MKRLLITVMVFVAASVYAEQILQEISWVDIARDGVLIGGLLDGDSLRVSNDSSQPMTQTVLVIKTPPITSIQYAVTGRVRYEGVEGVGYLEMWNVFGEHGAYFSRTLADSGLLKNLTGSSGWREFRLPFARAEDMPSPERLIINIVLSGRGSVYLSPLALVENGGHVWWGAQQAGWLGGIAGIALGSVGGLIGFLASKGKFRALVMALVHVVLVFGALSLIAGLIAVLRSQPYVVYYPLLLIGTISIIVMIANRVAIRRRYEDRELRQMESLDA